MHKYFEFFTANTHCALVVALSEKNEVTFSNAIGNRELMHECFSKHSHIGTARMKLDKERRRRKEERREYGKKQSGHERKKKSRRPKL